MVSILGASGSDPAHLALLATLEHFDAIVTEGAGAVIYSRKWDRTELPRNLYAASVATGMSLTSLDYAKRTYTTDQPEPPADDVDAYQRAYFTAKAHMRATLNSLRPASNLAGPAGTLAASVALQRLESSFRAAHLLYRLGLNTEGDGVARQILEQVAWAAAVREMDSWGEIGKTRSNSSLGALKALLPDLGRFYGELSDVAHASLIEHRQSVAILDDETSVTVLTRARFADSARILLRLADAWVVVCELVHQDLIASTRAVARDGFPNPEREFLRTAAGLVDDVERAEREGAEE